MINEVQPVLLELLEELDEVCDNASIPYSLGDRLAWDAVKFGGFHDRTYDAVIILAKSDFNTIEPILKALDNRDVLAISPDIFAFVAKDTTLIDLNRRSFRNVFGVFVVIKLMTISEEGASYVSPSGIHIDLPRDYLNSTALVSFERREFRLSTSHSDYFTVLVGQNWPSLSWPYDINRYRFGVIFDKEVPFSRFMQSASEAGLLSQATFDDWQYFTQWEATTLKRAKSKVYKDDRILGLWQERYRLLLKYYPSKKMILSRYEEGWVKAVEMAMDDYLKSLVEFYEKSKKAICFDDDLFELAADILESRGYETKARLRLAIPEGHRDPLLLPRDFWSSYWRATNALFV